MQKTRISKKIILTGGHAATTALSTIEVLASSSTIKWDIYWVGTKRALEGKTVKTLEFKVFPEYGVKCIDIISGRLQRKVTRHSLISLMRVPFGFFHALYILLQVRPNVIVSYGGFAAFPVVVCGWILRIPVILHEQTVAVGLANKFSSPFAKVVTLARSSSKKYFKNKNLQVIGNPIMQRIITIGPKKHIPIHPVIFVTGGSRGSSVINEATFEALPSLLEKYKVVHLTGTLDFEKAKSVKDSLQKHSDNYMCYSHINPLEIADKYKESDIVVGRAGANTVAEIAATGRVGVLIPIPWTRYDEQRKNALAAKEAGFGYILEQSNLNAKSLVSAIDTVTRDFDKMRTLNIGEFGLDKTAAKQLAEIISIHAK